MQRIPFPWYIGVGFLALFARIIHLSEIAAKDLPVGPPLPMKIAREALIEQLQSSGFRLAREHAFLPYQYFLVFVALE